MESLQYYGQIDYAYWTQPHFYPLLTVKKWSTIVKSHNLKYTGHLPIQCVEFVKLCI